MKKILAAILIFVGALLLIGLLWNSSDEPNEDSTVSYEFDYKDFVVQFVANGDYVFTDVVSEYGKLELPNIADATEGIQTVSISLKPLPLGDGEFIYLHLRKHNEEDCDYEIQIYEILYQNAKELYIARCENSVGGIYEWLDIYNPQTGELTNSR